MDELIGPIPTIPSIRYGTELNDALQQLQTLICRDEMRNQIKATNSSQFQEWNQYGSQVQ